MKTPFISFNIIVTLLLILLCGVGTTVSFAYVSDMQMKVSQAKKAVQTQKEANAVLRAEVTQRYSLDELARIAVERLDMNKPDAAQVIHINVPKENSVTLYDGPMSAEPEHFWQKIIPFFRRLWK